MWLFGNLVLLAPKLRFCAQSAEILRQPLTLPGAKHVRKLQRFLYYCCTSDQNTIWHLLGSDFFHFWTFFVRNSRIRKHGILANPHFRPFGAVEVKWTPQTTNKALNCAISFRAIVQKHCAAKLIFQTIMWAFFPRFFLQNAGHGAG